MSTFLDFLSDNTFFAIFSGVIVVLVLAFIVTLVKGKKGDKTPVEDISLEDALKNQNNNIVPNDGLEFPKEANVSPIDAMLASDNGYQSTISNYVPDLNSDTLPNTPIVDHTSDNLDTSEIVIPNSLGPVIPNGKEEIMKADALEEETPSIPIEQPIKEEVLIEDNMMPNFAEKENVDFEPIDENASLDLPKTNLAFASIPSDDQTINEDIEIEKVPEYDFEKTEIFDFPDFSKTEIDSEKIQIDVEKVVMEAANKYIESVMKS